MPVPLVVSGLVTILSAWVRRTLMVGGLAYFTTTDAGQDLWNDVKAWIVAEVARLSGLQLDPDNPFTDASMANAVGQKVGIPFRSLKDQVLIKEDLDNYVASVVSSRSGYNVRSVVNVAMLKEDLVQIGAAELSGQLGVPIGVFPGAGQAFDPVAIKENLLIWAKAELMTRVGDEVAIRMQDIVGAGDLVSVASQLNTTLNDLGSIENVTARQLAVRVASQLATSAVVDLNKMAAGVSKKSRRRELLRAYQAKFRARHGNRQIYVPLGMTSVVT